ncbi:hypothetical protein EMGBD1_01480 [Anaerolineaceae bacterium]|nr:hypothetical protein EMGBD1_01480 [Anaerolineaceae bacterium]
MHCGYYLRIYAGTGSVAGGLPVWELLLVAARRPVKLVRLGGLNRTQIS